MQPLSFSFEPDCFSTRASTMEAIGIPDAPA